MFFCLFCSNVLIHSIGSLFLVVLSKCFCLMFFELYESIRFEMVQIAVLACLFWMFGNCSKQVLFLPVGLEGDIKCTTPTNHEDLTRQKMSNCWLGQCADEACFHCGPLTGRAKLSATKILSGWPTASIKLLLNTKTHQKDHPSCGFWHKRKYG